MPPNRTINQITQAVRAVSESDWRSMPISPKRMKAKVATVEKVNVFTKELSDLMGPLPGCDGVG